MIVLITKYSKNIFFEKKIKKSVDEKNKKPKIHIVRWTERNEKSSLKTNLDNLCGHSLNSWAEIKDGSWKKLSVKSKSNFRRQSFKREPKKLQLKNLKWRVWSWLRLNAGGRLNTCKSNGNGRKLASWLTSGGRVSNTWGAAWMRGTTPGNGC